MNDSMIQTLQNLKDGLISVIEAVQQIESAQCVDLGFANLDLQRRRRCGTGEVIYAASKTPEQIIKIAESLREKGQSPVLMTRLSKEAADEIRKKLELRYDEVSRIGIVGDIPVPNGHGKVAVVTAGTSDIPVAEEAVKTLEFLGNQVERIYDVGVAGLTDVPVIAVPTSVGYGASFEGMTALLAMINSCAAGVSVVNIDNGFGAAYIASNINHQEIKG